MNGHCWPLCHDYQPVQATPLAEKWGSVTFNHKTRVLLTCTRCPRFRVREIEGVWSIEELLRKRDRPCPCPPSSLAVDCLPPPPPTATGGPTD